ncbi:MSMEG_6728 family protein, partial [Streptomyces sp. TRM76130]|nr:MSMEG_6728 family protein [Streptomyces sp. TRM76130]
LEICRVWREQGHQDSCAASLVAGLAGVRPGVPVRDQAELAQAGELPPWLGDEPFHLSHRSALVRKDPEIYGALFPGVPDDLPYVWPDSDRTGLL